MDKKKRRRRGSGSVVKRGNIYWLYHTRHGKLQGESLGSSNKQEADQLARKRLREIDEEIIRRQAYEQAPLIRVEPIQNPTRELNAMMLADIAEWEKTQRELKEITANPTLDEFWKLGEKLDQDSGLYIDWCHLGKRARNTLISYRTAWLRFRRYFKADIKRMRDVTPEIAKKFESLCATDKVGSRSGKGVSPEGVTQYVICMQGLFSTAINEAWLQGTNPFHVRYQHKRDRVVGFLTNEQITKLLEEAGKLKDKTVYLFIAIAVHTRHLRECAVSRPEFMPCSYDSAKTVSKRMPIRYGATPGGSSPRTCLRPHLWGNLSINSGSKWPCRAF